MTRRKRFYMLVVFSVMLISKAKAQLNVGIDAGITYNKLQFNQNDDELKISTKTGYIVNINIDQKLSKRFALEVSPGVIQKDYTVENKNNIYQNINNSYIHVPVSIKYDLEFSKKLTLSGALGAYYAYWIKSSIDGIAPNVFNVSNNSEDGELIKVEKIKSNYKFNAKHDNRTEFGWVAKIEMNYMILENVSCLIKGHYYQSITDQQKQKSEFQSQRYNQTSAMTIGVTYHFRTGKILF